MFWIIITCKSDTDCGFNSEHYVCEIKLWLHVNVCLCLQRPIMYGFMIGGWTVGIYFLQYLWHNLRQLIEQYQSHVLSYVVFTGIISFIICYRLGPVTDQRSKNLIKWVLQVLINVSWEMCIVEFNCWISDSISSIVHCT